MSTQLELFPLATKYNDAAALLAALRARFEREGVTVMRTLLARDNALILSFFRSQGMTAGRLIPLELAIGPGA